MFSKNWTVKIVLVRVIWIAFSVFFIKIMPKSLSPLRIFLLRLFGAKIGQRCLVCSGVKVWMPWNLKLGDYVTIGNNVEIYNFSSVVVGNFSVVSQDVYLCTASHDYKSSDFPLFYKDIIIGSYSWIAAKSIVLPGVIIGDNSVVGAGSVVSKAVLPNTINAGNPCRIIKDRKEG